MHKQSQLACSCSLRRSCRTSLQSADRIAERSTAEAIALRAFAHAAISARSTRKDELIEGPMVPRVVTEVPTALLNDLAGWWCGCNSEFAGAGWRRHSPQ